MLVDSAVDKMTYMMSTDVVTQRYKNELVEAVAELDSLVAAREELETKIAKQKRRVAALHELVEADEDGPPSSVLVDGITDACRTVLRAAEKPLLPIEVRDRVQKLGLPPQVNLLASVYTVLRRLKESGEVVEGFDFHLQPGGSAPASYEWANIARKRALGRVMRGEAPSVPFPPKA